MHIYENIQIVLQYKWLGIPAAVNTDAIHHNYTLKSDLRWLVNLTEKLTEMFIPGNSVFFTFRNDLSNTDHTYCLALTDVWNQLKNPSPD